MSVQVIYPAEALNLIRLQRDHQFASMQRSQSYYLDFDQYSFGATVFVITRFHCVLNSWLPLLISADISNLSIWKSSCSYGKFTDVLSPCRSRKSWTVFYCFSLELWWQTAVQTDATYPNWMFHSINDLRAFLNSIFFQNYSIFSSFLSFLSC